MGESSAVLGGGLSVVGTGGVGSVFRVSVGVLSDEGEG